MSLKTFSDTWCLCMKYFKRWIRENIGKMLRRCVLTNLSARRLHYPAQPSAEIREMVLPVWCPGGCFTNSLRAPQDIFSKFAYCRNRTSYENFKLKLCTCAQSHALGTRTKFQLEILAINAPIPGNLSNNVATDRGSQLWPLLLTWFNFNPSMDK